MHPLTSLHLWWTTLTVLPAHLGIYFLILPPDCNFFEGMKEILITFGSQKPNI